VEVGDPQVQRRVHHGVDVVLALRAPVLAATEGPAAQPQRGQAQAGGSTGTRLDGGSHGPLLSKIRRARYGAFLWRTSFQAASRHRPQLVGGKNSARAVSSPIK